MAITQKSIKLLWAASGGRCSFTDCWEKLCHTEAGSSGPFTIGEMAHICGERPGANRHDPRQTPEERDDYKNLILLCPTHHRLIDRRENEALYSVHGLMKIKSEHEQKIIAVMDNATQRDKSTISREIFICLEENHQAWAQYGPCSDVARRRPHSQDAYLMWISEKLSTIVPNNRKIVKILEGRRSLFNANEQQVISSFFLHARSYERWVQDEVSYEAVTRFPQAFFDMIKGIVDAGS